MDPETCKFPTPLACGNIRNLVRKTQHFAAREAERGLPAGTQDYILTWAQPVYRSGRSFWTLRRKDLPAEEQQSKLAARAMGWVLVLANDGSLVTTYWNPNAVGHLKKKPEQALKGGQLAKRLDLRRQEQEAERNAKKQNRKHRHPAKVQTLIPYAPFSPSAA